MQSGRICLVIAMFRFFVCFLICSILLPGIIVGQSEKKYPVIKVLSSEITGFVRYQDGETAVEELPIYVWDISQDRYLNDWETITDKNGRYSIKPLPNGEYFIEYNKVRIELHVIEAPNVLVYQPHDIIIVIPEIVAIPVPYVPITLTAGGLINIPFILRGFDPDPPPTPKIVSP